MSPPISSLSLHLVSSKGHLNVNIVLKYPAFAVRKELEIFPHFFPSSEETLCYKLQ